MRRLRVIVVGVGHLGRVHARILSKLPGARLIGVVDPDERARNEVAEACRTNAFADWRALEGKFDAAVVAAPTRCHHQIGLGLLNRGIHCLIEKPLCASSREAGELIAAARRGGAVLQVGHVERFNPALEPIRPYLRDPKFIQATRTSSFTCRSMDIGVVLDVMIHDIDLALSMATSPVRQVDAMGMTLLGPLEDVAHARLTFDNGCVALLNASRVSPVSTRRMHVWSQEGFSSIDFAARTSSAVVAGDDVRERRIDVPNMTADEQAELRNELFSRYFTVEDFSGEPCDQLTAELEDFVASIRDGRSPQVTGEQAHEAIGVAERILESIASHAWDGAPDGRVGPLSAPQADLIPSPHWTAEPAILPLERKEAG